MRITIPAVRIAVAVALNRKGMSETAIAKRLGIAQAAVSKYINGDYSKKVGRLVDLILDKKLQARIVLSASRTGSVEQISGLIDRAASERDLVEFALAE